MKQILTLLIALSFTLSAWADDIEDRLRSMECIVSVKADDAVLKRIKTMLRSRKDTEKMIGRSITYFPIFDKYLKEYELPEDLRYVTCLETELRNSTVSYAGATGIWQLMPDVKQEFGLRIDGVVDERYDLNRATEAALKDLKRMYKALGNWELTLAGYNCGIGCLTRAMKRAKSTDFEQVKKFLPQQTQQYISKFIAFTYIMKNYRYHNLQPNLPDLDRQVIGAMPVQFTLSLETVARVTGLPIETVKELNRHYGGGYIPAEAAKSFIYLPRRVMSALENYIAEVKADDQKPEPVFQPTVVDEMLPRLESDPHYFKTSYYVGDDETLDSIAALFNIEGYHILLWNNLPTPSVVKGQDLTLYLPRVVPKKIATDEVAKEK